MQLVKFCRANVVAMSVVGVGLAGGVAHAQSAAVSGVAATSGFSLAAPKPVPSLSFKAMPVQQVTDAIGRAAGVQIVTNTLIASAHIDFKTLGGSLDAVLTELARVLPPSGTVRAVLLPKSLTPDAAPDGDVVVAYLNAQDTLSKAGADAAKADASAGAADAASTQTFVPGEFEALGRRLAGDKAVALSVQMNLHPVYVVSVTRPPVNPVSKLAALQAEALRNYLGMTPDQRKTSMENQFNDLMNMDKGSREALLGQMMDQGAYMVNAMKNMPPAQLQEFQSEMMNAMQNSGMAGALGAGGGAKGNAGTGK